MRKPSSLNPWFTVDQLIAWVKEAPDKTAYQRRLAISLILFVLGAAAIAQESRPTIALKTFTNPANFSRSTIGNGLTEILTTELDNTGKFNVLERGNVDEITKEMDFANSDYAKNSSFAQKAVAYRTRRAIRRRT
jgi:curli biogenesis system outer membrane secretion channel CsgG